MEMRDAAADAHLVTQLLNQWGLGDRAAFDQLLPLVYQELHKIAKRSLARHSHSTLQTTGLIHEAFLKLVGGSPPALVNRAHFLAVAAKAMRHVLLDYARGRGAAKRGGEVLLLPVEDGIAADEPARDVIALDDALTGLASEYPRHAQVVELRYFGGLSVEETAQALQISEQTVLRDWRFAKSYLKREIEDRPG